MADRSPEFIQRWLDKNLHLFDGPSQYLGTEPNAVRKPWDSATVRWLVAASWPYMQAAGNTSIPAVYSSINGGGPAFLCDRFYLPSTPRDLHLLERGGVPVFGIESRHQLTDFDVVGTSISYSVLFVNFCKMLTMSGVPLRRRDREKNPADWPLVVIGGQATTHPDFMAAVADCFFLGECEDEEGNGGISEVCAHIARMKEAGLWSSDRGLCYRDLARTYSFLYFPRYTRVSYFYEDRGLPHPTKMVKAIEPVLDGMAFPLRTRKVKDLDKARLLTGMPIVFTEPGMGAGDVEVARGNIASSEYVLIHGEGLRPLGSWQGDALHPHDGDLGELKCDSGGRRADVSHVLMNGERAMVTVSTVGGHQVVCTPDHGISVVRGPAVDRRHPDSGQRGPREFWFSNGHRGKPSRLEVLSQRPREFVRADELVPGSDYIPVFYGQNVWSRSEQLLSTSGCRTSYSQDVELPEVLDEDVAWLLGMLAGDVTVKVAPANHVYTLRIQTEDPGVSARASQVLLRLFGRDVEPWTREGARAGRQTFELRSAAVLRWLDRNFGISDNKNRRRVPELILQSPRHIVAAYLSGFYDSDGTYDDRNGRPSWCSGSEELIRVVSLLLLNLGAPCSWRKSPTSRPGWIPGWIWSVQGLQASDGNWGWLQPSHTRRLVQIRRWQQHFAVRNGREAVAGVIYTPVKEVVEGGAQLSYDLAVPEYTSFTCNGMLVHNCTAWCSFCHLSWANKPYRQESVGRSVARAAEWRLNQGSLEMSPFSPDFPLHSQKKELSARLMEEVSDEVDTGAMRIDDFNADPGYSMLLAVGGTDAVTLGLEGNSQRMRDLCGKGVSDDDVAEAVTQAIRSGIRKIKLFMISNWPGEEYDDVIRIVELGRRLADIRESFGEAARGIIIQFSWTPLLIEAQTPMQWFAPTAPDYHLQEAMVRLRDEYRVSVKLGSKAQPAKQAFFQACQRASRDAGEAIADVIAGLDQASWGGMAKDMEERLSAALIAHGFRNGLEDLFGERYQDDMLGWEHIDTGVSRDLMWRAYRQMVEFLEGTNAATYDEQFDGSYRGAEWVARCDEQCSGASCGCCDRKDLELRRDYIQAQDRDMEARPLQSLDMTTVAFLVRAKAVRPEEYKYASTDFYKFVIRRAAYRAHEDYRGVPHISKRSVRLASEIFRYRDRSAGADYAEFGFTRFVTGRDLTLFMHAMNEHLVPDGGGTPWLELGDWGLYPPEGKLPHRPASLWELEVDGGEEELRAAVRRWDAAETVPVLLRTESFYSGVAQEEADAKDHVGDLWLVRDKSRLMLRMTLTGQLGPYQAHAALTGKTGLAAAVHTAVRVDFFEPGGSVSGSLLTPSCLECGRVIPVDLLGKPFDENYCPRCRDEVSGVTAGGLTRQGV